jgi:hypothetical protein
MIPQTPIPISSTNYTPSGTAGSADIFNAARPLKKQHRPLSFSCTKQLLNQYEPQTRLVERQLACRDQVEGLNLYICANASTEARDRTSKSTAKVLNRQPMEAARRRTPADRPRSSRSTATRLDHAAAAFDARLVAGRPKTKACACFVRHYDADPWHQCGAGQ